MIGLYYNSERSWKWQDINILNYCLRYRKDNWRTIDQRFVNTNSRIFAEDNHMLLNYDKILDYEN